MIISFCPLHDTRVAILFMGRETETYGHRAGEWRGWAWNPVWKSESSLEFLLLCELVTLSLLPVYSRCPSTPSPPPKGCPDSPPPSHLHIRGLHFPESLRSLDPFLPIWTGGHLPKGPWGGCINPFSLAGLLLHTLGTSEWGEGK